LAISEIFRRGKGGQERRNGLAQSWFGRTAEQVGDDFLLDAQLLLAGAGLEITAAADPVVGAGRDNPVGRGGDDRRQRRLDAVFFSWQDFGLDLFAGQDMANQNDLAIVPAGQAVSSIDDFFYAQQDFAHFFP
jgi:hypothetical protein